MLSTCNICNLANVLQNADNVMTSTDLTLTMFQPRLKSGGAGVLDRFRRGAVYEVPAVAVTE